MQKIYIAKDKGGTMYLKLIACKVMQREFASLIFRCPNTIDVTMVRQRYHDVPKTLQQLLQDEIDRIDGNTDPHTNDLSDRPIDAIVLGYGLCSNAVVGLRSKKYRIVIPRAHDCTTLLLGSKEKYQEYFETHKGSYFASKGWLELGVTLGDEEERLGRLRQEYMDKYDDEDTVEYLLDMERKMLANYSCMTYVDWPELADGEAEAAVREIAEKKQWQFHYEKGSSQLMKDLLDGNWDEKRFLILEPGEAPVPSYDENVIRAQKS